ncbi:SpoIIE family protein phosphatase [Streptomyces sp. NPDC005731]|uniref:SpoIIE family protein phosphatase n=1 Tax=Streptomyces sp. NPDC005731 TaxID=3157056 RepID=UPI00340FAB7C
MGSSAETAASQAQPAIETISPAIALLDAQGTVVGWSQAARRLLGYSAAEAVGRSAGVLLVAAEDRAMAAQAAQESTLWGRWSDFARVRHRDGHSIDVRLHVSSLSGQDGPDGWVVWATDKAMLPAGQTGTTGVVPFLATLLLPSRLPIGVGIQDTNLRCVWGNDIQGSWDGVPLPQRLGRRLTEAAPGTGAETLEAVMHQVLETGDSAMDVDYPALLPANVRSNRILTASFFRLDDAQERALGVCMCTVSVDVTDSGRARERLAILGEASRRIGTTLDVMQTSQELADLAVPFLADYATVDLAESVPLGEEPLAHLGPQDGRIPVFRRAGLASVHPGTPESLFARGEPVFVPPTSPFTKVLRSGKSHFEPILDTSPGTWLDYHGALAEKIREHVMHSLMVVPIRARGVVLGVAVFVRTEDPRPFQEDDLLLAEELVSWAALALDNARRYIRERSAALALQRLLHPHRPTGGSAADVAWRYLPADSYHGIGGDWFDVIPLSGARVALVVGDVVGHGVNAAAKMGQLRTVMHTLAEMDMPPDEVLARLDEQVIRLTEAEADPSPSGGTTMAATCLYAVYDPVTRYCAMARAGHPPPAVIDPCGHVTFPDLPAGAPLGLELVPFESVTLKLAEGSLLALYTDGLIEARDQDISVGMNRLRAALARPHHTLDDLCSSTVDTLRAKPPSDDVTLLLARTHALNADQVASWQFPSDLAVVSRARTLAARQLNRWGLEDLAESTELIVSELFANAIIHGNSKRTVDLRLIRHRMLTCEVSDASHCHPLLRHPRTSDERGRGLFLVTQLSHRWGTRHIPDGKVIWVDQRLPASA